MDNSLNIPFVMLGLTSIEKWRNEVINKALLKKLYIEYFGEANGQKIEERIDNTYDFVIPIDIQKYNIQKYLLTKFYHSNSAFNKSVAETAKKFLYRSSRNNALLLIDSGNRFLFNNLLNVMSVGEEEPFTLENVLGFNIRKAVFSPHSVIGKGERFAEFYNKLFNISTEDTIGFESYETITQNLILDLLKIKGVKLNPNLTFAKIQNEFQSLFDINSLRGKISDERKTLQKIFNMEVPDAEAMQKDPVWSKIYSTILSARTKFCYDYLGSSIDKNEVIEFHWYLFEEDPILKNDNGRYTKGYDSACYTSFKRSAMGDMYHIHRAGVGEVPVIRIALDDRTAFSTVAHEVGHAIQLKSDNFASYTGFNKTSKNDECSYAAFNEFYNQFLTLRIIELAKKEKISGIQLESGSAYNIGVAVLKDFFEAFEDEFKDHVLDDGFAYAQDRFGAEKFSALANCCTDLRFVDTATVKNLLSYLEVPNLEQAKYYLRDHEDVLSSIEQTAACMEDNADRKLIGLASTIRAIDNITEPFISEKTNESMRNGE